MGSRPRRRNGGAEGNSGVISRLGGWRGGGRGRWRHDRSPGNCCLRGFPDVATSANDPQRKSMPHPQGTVMSDLFQILFPVTFGLTAIAGLAFIAIERLVSYRANELSLRGHMEEREATYGWPFYRVKDEFVFSSKHKHIGDITLSRYVLIYRLLLVCVMFGGVSLGVLSVIGHFTGT